MNEFDPAVEVANSVLILDRGAWPNFHDAEVHRLSIWRGDVRPEDDVWIGPRIDAEFALCALQYPYLAVIRFHDCEDIRLADFNHQNAIYDLGFAYEARGTTNDGVPLTPYICVQFEQAFGAALSFKCFRIEALARKDLPGVIGEERR